MPALNTPICEFGRPAPDFALPSIVSPGLDGEIWRLAMDLMGAKGLLVDVPLRPLPLMSARSIDRIARDARKTSGSARDRRGRDLLERRPQAYPEDGPESMARQAADAHGFGFSYLRDESQDQSVARAYEAVCTPDFFGFNADLGLQYRGRLDASRADAGPADLRRDLFEAMRQVAETGRGPADQIASIGCSIKWREPA